MIPRILTVYRFRQFSTVGPPKGGWWNRYERWLEKYPRVYKYHRLMVDGTKHCYSDTKTFTRVATQIFVKKVDPQTISRWDLEIYMLTLHDIVKILGILIFMVTPTPIGEIYFALMLCFPRTLLTRHFWTTEQKKRFMNRIFQEQAQHRDKIVASLLSELADRKEKEVLDFVKALVGSKSNPLSLSDLRHHAGAFTYLGFDQMSFSHKFHLARAHELWPFPPFYTKRLCHRAFISRAIDAKLSHEYLEHLNLLELDQSLYLRKLNAQELTECQKRQLLMEWISATKANSSDSFILHAPILVTKLK